MDKDGIRKELLARRAALSPEEWKLKSRAIQARLLNREEYRRAKTVHFYMGFKNEVETDEVIRKSLEAGKQVVVPWLNDKTDQIELSELKDLRTELRENKYGIKEPYGPFIRPVDRRSVQLAVIPGVAFDPSGNRIGFGKGFYDKLFSQNRTALLIGLAFEFQIVKSIPSEEHDIKMNKILTEYRTIEITQKEIRSKI
ncbi:MAG: 5-formyltetrahydrofolate cyclo-ligase [Nitrospirae bacterium]|nr:5-formyltetrahydrofolate cyclo-ligase [Nitrospirota bacterium]MBI3352315.1 5-formyltetrahydrofolate cyclo-ligase [Nitrospirota bacterium]